MGYLGGSSVLSEGGRESQFRGDVRTMAGFEDEEGGHEPRDPDGLGKGKKTDSPQKDPPEGAQTQEHLGLNPLRPVPDF